MEDVPTGLVPMCALGAAVGVPAPVLNSIIRLARVLAGRDFAAESRTIERLGLGGQDAGQIRSILQNGFEQPHEAAAWL